MLGFLFSFGIVLLCVGLHYEGLRQCSRVVRMMRIRRLAVAFSILGALIAHMLEILVFALGMVALIGLGMGALEPAHRNFGDLLYFSAVAYTSLGFGDVIPSGSMRQLAGIEALTGLVMIAWTASFSFVQMESFWGDR